MQQQVSSFDFIAPGLQRNALVQLYDVGFKHRLLIPAEDILYVPQHVLQGRTPQPMLCQRNQFCNFGTTCDFVHARVNNAQKCDPGHVNFAWKTAQKCKKYERLPAGRQIEVFYPTKYLKSYIEAGSPSCTVPSEHLLKTKVIENCSLNGTHRPTVCIHFLLNRICSRGAECNFAHVIHIDADAKPHQRAPTLVRLQSEAAPASSTSTVYNSVPPPTMPTILDTEETVSNQTSDDSVLSLHSTMSCNYSYSYRHDPYAAQVIGKATARDHSSDDDFPEAASVSMSTMDTASHSEHASNSPLSTLTTTPRIPCRPVPARKRCVNALVSI